MELPGRLRLRVHGKEKPVVETRREEVTHIRSPSRLSCGERVSIGKGSQLACGGVPARVVRSRLGSAAEAPPARGEEAVAS